MLAGERREKSGQTVSSRHSHSPSDAGPRGVQSVSTQRAFRQRPHVAAGGSQTNLRSMDSENPRFQAFVAGDPIGVKSHSMRVHSSIPGSPNSCSFFLLPTIL
jgi:hypothetical protein